MKTRTLSLIVGLFIIGMGSTLAQHDHSGHMGGNHNAEAPEAFKKQLNGVFTEYLVLKDAFVASDEDKIEAAAKNTLTSLDKVDMSLLKGDAHTKWMGQLKDIKSNLNGIVQMNGIEMKRSHFSVVSKNLSSAVNKFGVESTQKIYVDYCPMASNNQGAIWLSADKEIRNPYFGDKMLKCGEIQQTIN